MHKQTIVCAHRGASGSFPENTIPAFAEAVALGCGMVEFDVRATADGALVILHDAAVDRTTDGAGSIWELSFQQVEKLDASAGHSGFSGTRMPTLQEVLDFLPREIELNIHVYPGPDDGEAIVGAVCREIRARDL
jgi:glycerophosphoryl diester phosphodiesterase